MTATPLGRFRRRRRSRIAAPCVAAGLLIATPNVGTSEPPTDELSAAIEELIEQAEAEGGTLLTTWSPFNTPEMLDAWEEDFAQIYGIPLQIENVPSPSFSQNVSQVVAEMEAGRTASTDLLLATDRHLVVALDGGAVEPREWLDLGGNLVSDDQLDSDGTAVAVSTVVYGTTFNREAIAEEDVPSMFEEFVDLPEQYALATTPEASNIEAMSMEERWGEERLRDWFDLFADRIDGTIDCADMTRLTSGEFDILAVDCGPSYAEAENARGADLGWKLLDDLAILKNVYVAPTVHAEHPATAMLFANYLAGASAQAILFEHENVDVHTVEGSYTGAIIDEAEARGVEFVRVDGDANRANPQFVDIQEDFIAILEGR